MSAMAAVKDSASADILWLWFGTTAVTKSGGDNEEGSLDYQGIEVRWTVPSLPYVMDLGACAPMLQAAEHLKLDFNNLEGMHGTIPRIPKV